MLEADFARFYGKDLGAAVFGRRPMSLRKVWSLVRHLPPDSAFAWMIQREGQRPHEIVTTDLAEAARIMRSAG